MGPFEVAFVKAVVVGVFVVGTGLSIFRLRLRFRGQQTLDADREVEALRSENSAQRAAYDARLAELEERVDFVERRLAQPRPEARRLNPPLATPV